MSVDGRVAIVTGAGGGLGRCHALLLAEHGARVVVNDLGGNVDGSGQGDMADRVVEEIRDNGGEAVANKASVATRTGAKSIVEDAVSAFGTLDIVVNNAGILRDKSFKKMTLDEWDIVINVHLNGTAYVTWHAWPIMYEKNYGRVIFTSSVSGIFGSFGQSNYGAAKMGMVGLMNNLAREGASHNVRTNCLSPGAATRMTASVPGSTIDPDNPNPANHPGLVSPAVLYWPARMRRTGGLSRPWEAGFPRTWCTRTPALISASMHRSRPWNPRWRRSSTCPKHKREAASRAPTPNRGGKKQPRDAVAPWDEPYGRAVGDTRVVSLPDLSTEIQGENFDIGCGTVEPCCRMRHFGWRHQRRPHVGDTVDHLADAAEDCFVTGMVRCRPLRPQTGHLRESEGVLVFVGVGGLAVDDADGVLPTGLSY